jgi:putative peptide zinc metalloprotease protein
VTAIAFDGGDAGKAADVLIVGPDEYVDGRVLCFAKNRTTGRYFRLGRRESVILRGVVDGLPPDATSKRYLATTGRPLNEASYLHALSVFGKAGMFATTAEAGTSDEPLLAPPPTLFSFNIYSWNPDADLERIVSLLRWVASPWTFAAIALAVLIVEALVLASFGPILHQALAQDAAILPWRIALFLAINGFMFLVHEGAHALVCKAYGGEVREMGFQIRYLAFTPYTRLDDVLLFENRWKRAGVFLAGPLASLSILPLAFAAWTLFPEASLGRQTAADFLIWYNLLFLLQFLPFLQFDGYHIVAQFLHMPQLRQDAYAFIYGSVLGWFGKGERQPIATDVARYVKPIYIGYGAASFLITAAVLALLIGRYSHVLANWLGPLFGYGLTALLLAMMLARFVTQLTQTNRKAAR